MLTQAENELLTQTDSTTPMGQYFRRFWQPVALSREVAERDDPPVKVTVMGEQLVAFRDTGGHVGLVDAHCPHRGANLYFGRNEECGLRCVYHGWKFDRHGNVVDMPNVPASARMRDEVRIKSYPTAEYGDLVWAYLGPQDGPRPELPQLEFGLVGAQNRYVSKRFNECNWAQTMEGGLDTSHFSFLHMPAPAVPSDENPDAPADARRLRWIRNDPMPQFHILEHDVGFVIGGARDGDEGEDYWRITQYLVPAHGTGPSALPGETYFGYTLVPVNDRSHWIYTYGWNPERELTKAEVQKLNEGHGIVAAVDAQFRGIRNRGNDYLIDRHAQKHDTYTGVKGLAEQDAMIQESQGDIVDRTRENLTATDAAVVRFRRTVIDGANSLLAGGTLQAPLKHEHYKTRPGSWMTKAGTPMEEVMVERFGDRLGRLTK